MPAAVGGGGGAAAVWASGETQMKANSSTKQRAGFVFMEIPKWIKIRDIFGVKLDPVTLIFRVPLNEILAIFSEDRWETTSRLAESSATLNNAPPDVTLQKSLMGGPLLRLHVRLWKDGIVIGNAHLDIPTLAGHVANHTIGKSYVAYMFYKRGYAVNLAYLANEHEDHDGFAVEIYKPDERR
jgi:hypothetical protein